MAQFVQKNGLTILLGWCSFANMSVQKIFSGLSLIIYGYIVWCIAVGARFIAPK